MANSEQPAVLFLVPGDPGQKTGGYRYVSRLVSELNQRGTSARVEGLEGRFPEPDSVAERAMESALGRCKDGATVVLDGLAMGAMPEVVAHHASRLQIWALVHHPLADETGLGEEQVRFFRDCETRALAAVGKVIVTSRATARRLEDFGVPPEKVTLVEPGANTVEPNRTAAADVSWSDGPLLICVATLSPRKAQHQLIEALWRLQDSPWQCALVGSTERDPAYSQAILSQIQRLKLDDRIRLVGELDDDSLADYYRNADLFVLPSLYEGYGMVIDEALAMGLPVITSDGGALATTGDRPGVRQYSAGSVDGLFDCLESCLLDARVLSDMSSQARETAKTMRNWSDAAKEFAQALSVNSTVHPTETDHSQFDEDWLSLREPADHGARNRSLLEQVRHWANQWVHDPQRAAGQPLRIVDLGAGAGSNGVFLSQALDIPQDWTLLDQDDSLLKVAASRLSAGLDCVENVEILECRLDERNLAGSLQTTPDLITASALIDLVSVPWLEALANAATSRRAGVYIVLSYAGDFRLNPPHPDDDLIRSLVNQHQHGEKGGGAALGPDATACLASLLEARDFSVVTAPSPWQLGRNDSVLQTALITGWCEAALEQSPSEAPRIHDWQSRRLAEADKGVLSVTVAHEDLFARPGHD